MRRAWSLVSIATFIGVAAGCAGQRPAPATLGDLCARPRLYEGRRVETAGVVEAFTDGGRTYYVITDKEAHRVALRPDDAGRPWASRTVTVVGIYGFAPATGRFIRVESIAASPERAGG